MTSLKQFVEQYDNALKSKIEKENKADFASFNSCFPLITDCDFEKQLQEAYTNEIFKLFQDELRGIIYCNLTITGSHGAVCSILVSDIVRGKECAYRKQVVYNVYMNEEEFDIKCSYQLFEFKGIICRHICKVLIERNVKDILSRYILPRWRRDIKRMHTYVINCYDDPQTNEEKLRYNKLCSHFTKAAELGAESNEKYMFLMEYVDEAIKKSMDNPICKEKFTPMLSEATNVPHQKFLSPLKVQSKGRPPSKRKKSKVEEIITRNKKKVFLCSIIFITSLEFFFYHFINIHAIIGRRHKQR
ncbi:FHY3/FAR1 family protein [Dioscorea alata]|uniref:FHY3/FAR1 family protein n=1 Tax=Dioscorea alata TaxID=55571 RepID=A0ACB7WKC2_DIOAL|nr:FHY3/FAR1 family protein [Dioscorea alata]